MDSFYHKSLDQSISNNSGVSGKFLFIITEILVFNANSADLDQTQHSLIFLPASPASYTHNLVSGTQKIYTCESLNSHNTMENCSIICNGLVILSWDSLNINHASPLDSVEPKGK